LTDKGKVVIVSSKGHANLGELADHKMYIAHKDPDGTIHLVPATAVPARRVSRPRTGQALRERLQDEFPDYEPPKDPWTDSSI
jgi:hypothetical protein